jgi:hypothetical protein
MYRDNPEQGLVNRENLGYVPMDLILLRSRDGGLSWDGPSTIDPPLAGPSFETCHGIQELRDGRWVAPTSTWKGWDGAAPNGMNAVLLISHDRGRSWPEATPVMAAYSRGIIHWEQSLVELDDGRLVSVAWAVEEASGKTLPTPYALSNGAGQFGPPRATGLQAQTAKILRLADGRLFCMYRHNEKLGLWACLVRIEGDDWVTLGETSVWQGAGSGMNGEQAAGDELSALKFGYPSMVQLPDGDVFAVFWCLEDHVHNIRWARIRLES